MKGRNLMPKTFKVNKETVPNKLAAALVGITESDGEVYCLASGSETIECLMYAMCVANNIPGVNLTMTVEFSGEKEENWPFRVRALVKRG